MKQHTSGDLNNDNYRTSPGFEYIAVAIYTYIGLNSMTFARTKLVRTEEMRKNLISFGLDLKPKLLLIGTAFID